MARERLNILVTGADGQLGQALRRATAESTDCYIYTNLQQLDITDYDSVEAIVEDKQIDVIVNCAAYTDVEKAEAEPAKAEIINAIAVGNLARAIKRRGGTLVHISTDYVFGGSKGNTPIDESEPVRPTSVYGLTKLQGEQAIAESSAKALIIRTSWLYSETGRNFVKTMLNLTGTRQSLEVVFDQCGTPTYAADLAASIFRIIEDRKFAGNEGIYHFSNEGVCSWYDFAKAIAEIAGNLSCDIRPCHSDEFPSVVVRPSYSVLDKTKFKDTFGINIPYWTDSLKVCINNLKALDHKNES